MNNWRVIDVYECTNKHNRLSDALKSNTEALMAIKNTVHFWDFFALFIKSRSDLIINIKYWFVLRNSSL